MQCPNDQTTLLMTERQGLEIDYCPTCRGIWLDRGELDKLIAASSAPSPDYPQQQPQARPAEQHYQQPYKQHDDHHYKKRKKESFIGDLFDF